MPSEQFQFLQLRHELPIPTSGKASRVLSDDAHAKVVLFAFAAGAGLAEHVAPRPAIIQIIQGEAELSVGDQRIAGQPGTWVRMSPQTPHGIVAVTPVLLLLTLLQ